MNSEQTPKIALLNDLARVTLCDCRVVVTPGIAEMGQLDAIITKVQAFDGFTERNDPYGEHDFGSVEHNGQTVFWKFDYYDVDMLMLSPDPTDATVTQRVLTIMLAEEY